MSQGRRMIPMEQFTVSIDAPINRNNALFVNILENGNFNLDGKLAKEVNGRKLDIHFTSTIGTCAWCRESGSSSRKAVPAA